MPNPPRDRVAVRHAVLLPCRGDLATGGAGGSRIIMGALETILDVVDFSDSRSDQGSLAQRVP